MIVSEHFAAHRIAWSRLIVVCTLVLVFVSEPPRYLPDWANELIELSGYALLVGAALWRIWALVFIGGSKDGELSTSGPYSVVRNPLYLGNFAGVVGFGLAVSLPFLALALGLMFALLYPAVVAREEARLAEIFGARFASYCERVPRWIPDWSLYQEPERVSVSPARVREGILDAMWFLWAFAFVELLDLLRDSHIITPLF